MAALGFGFGFGILTAFLPSAELPVEVAAEQDEDQRQDDQRADHSDPQIVDDHMHVRLAEDLTEPGGLGRVLGSVPQVGQVQDHRLGQLLGADAAVRRPAAGRSGVIVDRRIANPLEQGIERVEGVDVAQVVGTGDLEGDLVLLQVLGYGRGAHAAGRGRYELRVQLLGRSGGLHQWVIRGADHCDFISLLFLGLEYICLATGTNTTASRQHVNKSHFPIYKSWALGFDFDSTSIFPNFFRGFPARFSLRPFAGAAVG